MTDGEKRLMRLLLDGWEGACHSADTYLQIVQKVPNYRSLVDQWRDDPTRIEMTKERFRSVRVPAEAWLAGMGDDSLFRLLDEMQPKKPD